MRYSEMVALVSCLGLLELADIASAEVPTVQVGPFVESSPPLAYSALGAAVAVDGEWCAVGVPGDDEAGVNAGAVEVFLTQTWSRAGVLYPSLAVAGDQWGDAIALSGDTLLLGSRRSSAGPPNSGRVVVFRREGNSWIQANSMLPSDLVADGQFGASIAADGATAIIGAPGAVNSGIPSGAAYIASQTGATWSVVKRFSPTVGEAQGRYGSSVTISGGWAAIGAPGDDQGGADSGAVYLLRRIGTQWFAAGTVVSPSPQPGDRFGVSVSLSGSTLAVGAYRRDETELDSGAVFIYSLAGTSWSLTQVVAPSELVSGSEFGYSVCIHGSSLVVGAPMAPGSAGVSQGRAWIFEAAANWGGRVQMEAADQGEFALFGNSVATDGTTVVIGAPLASPPGVQLSGRAYHASLIRDCDNDGVRDLEELPVTGDCNANGLPDDCDVQLGSSPDADGNGVPDECQLADCNSNGIPDVEEISSGLAADCNENEIPDDCDLAAGSSRDQNGDGIPDECEVLPCVADLNGDRQVDGADLAQMLGNWSGRGLGDLNSDGQVDGADLAAMLAAWGSCA